VKLDYLHLVPGRALPTMDARPFRAILIAEQGVEEAWRNDVATWLVDSGCLYFIAWGESCETWHDSVDWAVLDKFDFGEIPDDQFVMTTWHENEPLSEALWFVGNCASHPDIDLQETLLVHVGPTDNCTNVLAAYADSQDRQS
jgi:hypothetical protein